jgi:xylan 1,4-beta-xylosidase
MLGKLDGERIPLSSSGALSVDQIIANKVLGQPDIDGLATASADAAQVLIWNYHDDVAAAQPATVQLVVQPPQESIRRARITHYRIDDTHSNAYTRWLQLGSPKAPAQAQYAELQKAGELELLESVKSADLHAGQLSLDFALPRLGVSLIEIRWIR